MKVAETYGRRFGFEVYRECAFWSSMKKSASSPKAVLIYRKQTRPEQRVSEEESKAMLARELADIPACQSLTQSCWVDLQKAIEGKWLGKIAVF